MIHMMNDEVDEDEYVMISISDIQHSRMEMTLKGLKILEMKMKVKMKVKMKMKMMKMKMKVKMRDER